MITLKTPDELAIMRKASTIVAEILEELAGAVRPGITTFELDKMAEELTYKKGAKPAFKGYQPGDVPYPEDAMRLGKRGNRPRDPVEPQAEAGRYRRTGLRRGVRRFLWRFGADSAGRQGFREHREAAARDARGALSRVLSNAARATASAISPAPCNAMRRVRVFRWSRSSPATASAGAFMRTRRCRTISAAGCRIRDFKAGMVIAIEPMVNEGTPRLRILKDGWTAVTADGKLSAHFEHSVAITDNGPEILSELDHHV